MTHISRYQIDEKINDELDKLLENTFSDLPNQNAKALLRSLFTNTELMMIKKRLGYLYLREKGLPQVDIEKALKITRQTLSRFSMQKNASSVEGKKVLYQKIASSSRKITLLDIIKSLSEIDISRSSMRKNIRKSAGLV